LSYSEVVRVYEVGPIAVSDDQEQDCTYRVEVLRDGPVDEGHRLFVRSKDKYFVNRPETSPQNARRHDNPYKVEVGHDPGSEEHHQFSWDKDKFVQLLKMNPDDWLEKLIEAKDNTVLWEEIKGPTVEDVLDQFTEQLLASFSSLEGNMRNLKCRELIKTVDLEPISIPETNQFYQFRIEILRDEGSDPKHVTRVYRLENYSLQPTFGTDGELAYDIADCWLWIEDEQNLLGTIKGSTVDEMVEQAVKARDKLEVRLHG